MTEYSEGEVARVKRKYFLTTRDLMVLTGYGRTRASQLMGKILQVSDGLGYGRGRCLREDYELYLKHNRLKQKEKLKEKEIATS